MYGPLDSASSLVWSVCYRSQPNPMLLLTIRGILMSKPLWKSDVYHPTLETLRDGYTRFGSV